MPIDPEHTEELLNTKAGYHHGNLRRILLDATVQVIETDGIDALSMRELAKIAGVSSAAPFRHFANRSALLAAVAEEAMERLEHSIQQALDELATQNPLEQFRGIGLGFLNWVIANPTHFQVISTRALIDFAGSTLQQRNDAIRQQMTVLLEDAKRQGLIQTEDIQKAMISARALVYGLARMYIDGQFPSWHLNKEQALEECVGLLDFYLETLFSLRS